MPGAFEGFEMTREEAEAMIMQARVKAGWITEADLVQPQAEEARRRGSDAERRSAGSSTRIA